MTKQQEQTLKMSKILSNDDHAKVTRLQKQLDIILNDTMDQIGVIFEPIMKNLDKYTNEELQNLIDTMPPVHFYRAEIRAYLKNRRTQGVTP